MEKEKFQGREFQAIVQAPDEESIVELTAQLSRFAKTNGLDSINVLDIGPDPDGGYKATISAHNWNPVKWVKSKFKSKSKGQESVKQISYPGQSETGQSDLNEIDRQEQLRTLREKVKTAKSAEELSALKQQAENLTRQTNQTTSGTPDLEAAARKAEAERQRFEEELRKQRPKSGKTYDNYQKASGKAPPPPRQEKMKKPSKAERRRQEFIEGWTVYGQQNIAGWETLSDQQKAEALFKATKGMPQERAEATSKAYREAAQSAAEVGAPFNAYEKVKQYQPGHYVDTATGKAVPQSERDKPGVEYVPGQITIQNVPVRRSPAQVMYESELMKTGIESIKEQREQIASVRRQRKWAPIRQAGNVAKEIMGVTMLGTAGVAQGMQPGRGGPQRAQRMLAPSVDMRLYGMGSPQGVPTMRPKVDLSPIRSAVIPRGIRAGVHQARKLRLF